MEPRCTSSSIARLLAYRLAVWNWITRWLRWRTRKLQRHLANLGEPRLELERVLFQRIASRMDEPTRPVRAQ
jgi:hypothetical protein